MDALSFEKEDIVTGRAYRRERERITAAQAAYLNNPLELTAHSAGFLVISSVFCCGPQLSGSVRLRRIR
jgi:hypothetical protein